MFFMRKSNVMFRNYELFGYITDNRNFGYKKTNDKKNDIGDKIVSQSGAVFLSVLERKPQAIDVLANKIHKEFTDIDIRTIKNDAIEFYYMLERDGFVVSGDTFQDCNNKEIRFSYNHLESEIGRKGFNKCNNCIKRPTQEFLEEYFEGKSQLTNLHMEIISECNERCLHCYIPHSNKVGEMKPDMFYDILTQCREMKLLHLTISGGEPMLHSQFCDFLKKCREYEFSVNVLSNLTLLNDEIITEMKANPLLGVQVSLYSMEPSIHDRITQVKGSFEATKNAILKLIENDIPLQISCPIMKQNVNSYSSVVDWAKKHNIHVGDDYTIIARYNHTTENLSCRLSIDEIKDVVSNIIANDATYLQQIENELEKKKHMTEDDIVCSVCYSSICINDNGNVYPCAGWQDYIVGNISKTPLKDIWENSEKVHYLRNLRKKEFNKCIQCPDKEFCTMCMVRNANESPVGDPLEVNEYFCDIAKINKKLFLEWKDNSIDS